ncbi:MAG: flavin-containing monooxygenase [Chloroflexota bacterium]
MSRQRLNTDVVVVGAGPAGLATATCLKKYGIESVVLEQSDRIGAAWHRHYERLHLHTDKWTSALPYMRFPREYPRYPSRRQVIAYLNRYANTFGIEPHFNQRVKRITRTDERWEIATADRCYQARSVVVATGFARKPLIPRWPEMDEFGGQILHSSEFRDGEAFEGKDVLVVGFGNSGGEIAIDLAEHGARPAISVRSPVNLLPRDLLGIPILWVAIAQSKLPARVADLISAPVLRAVFGDLRELGFKKLPYGPKRQIDEHQRIPLIDVGTVDLIRNGRLKVYPGLERFTERAVVFDDGTQRAFDAVILATGYRPRVDCFLQDAGDVLNDIGCPRKSGGEPALPGLYFCGFMVSYTGMFRRIAKEARSIAAAIAGELAGLRRSRTASSRPEQSVRPPARLR